jgi:hypothetical protein
MTPGTRPDGTRCLRGELSRSLTTTDHKGQRHYPAGTPITLIRNPKGDSYSLLATLPDEPDAPRAIAAELQREIASVTDREREIAIPF